MEVRTGSRKERERERVWENIWRDYNKKLSKHRTVKIQVQETQSPIQDKLKAKQDKTYVNQTKKKKKKKIKSSKKNQYHMRNST